MNSETTKPKETPDGESAPVHRNCYALIPYKPPDQFTASEAATFNHGTHAERLAVIEAACIRSLSIPAFVLDSGQTNYSSPRSDLQRYSKNR